MDVVWVGRNMTERMDEFPGENKKIAYYPCNFVVFFLAREPPDFIIWTSSSWLSNNSGSLAITILT